MSNVSWAVLTVQMTCCTRHVVSVTERSHLKVIQARLKWMAELVEGHGVGHVHHRQLPDLGGAVHAECERLGLNEDRVPVGPALVPHVPHVEAWL